MTAKEKAQELVDLFYDINSEEESHKGTHPYISRKFAKQCALRCVDKILNGSRLFYIEDYEYWKQVKKEIKEL